MYLGFSARFWVYSLLTFALIIVTFIDLEFQIIPDEISIGGIFLGIALSSFIPALQGVSIWKEGLIGSLSGALIGAGIIYLMGVFGKFVFKKEAMGGGDVKLMAMLGSFLGWKMAILIFFLAPFFGTPAGLYLKFKKNTSVIPYGPYIAIASFVAMIWGDSILSILFI
jgi:leader peptidase (prepilin peptidase)/N-methyltransferase